MRTPFILLLHGPAAAGGIYTYLKPRRHFLASQSYLLGARRLKNYSVHTLVPLVIE
jgi:hypothetical protein